MLTQSFFATVFSLTVRYVPLPKGEVHKKKEVVQDVTLHDLDAANAKPQVLPLSSYDRMAGIVNFFLNTIRNCNSKVSYT